MLFLRYLLLPFVFIHASVFAQDEAVCKELYPKYAEAVWPKDIVSAAKGYLQKCSANKDEVNGSMASATISSVVLQKLPMGRTTYLGQELSAKEVKKRRSASLGNANDAYEIALSLEEHSSQYVWWLQFSAGLGNGKAAYAVALHYRYMGQPSEASVWEAKANELGYHPLTSLDHRRN